MAKHLPGVWLIGFGPKPSSILSIRPFGTNFSEVLINLKMFLTKTAFENIVYKMTVIMFRFQSVKNVHFIISQGAAI